MVGCENRRIAPRLATTVRTRVGSLFGHTVNISQTGLRLVSDCPPSGGDLVDIEFEVDHGRKVKLWARAVWNEKLGSSHITGYQFEIGQPGLVDVANWIIRRLSTAA